MTKLRYTLMTSNGAPRVGWYNVWGQGGSFARLGDVHKEGTGWVARAQDGKVLGSYYKSRAAAGDRLAKAVRPDATNPDFRSLAKDIADYAQAIADGKVPADDIYAQVRTIATNVDALRHATAHLDPSIIRATVPEGNQS